MEYDTIFTKRFASYLYAINTYPKVMYYENMNIVNSMNIQKNNRILHIASAGVHIEPFIGISCDYVRTEENRAMAEMDNVRYSPLNMLPFSENSFDKIVIVATLHHYNEDEREQLYGEVCRILKPGGKFVICDVEENSEQDLLLNQCVDRYNPFGHKGLFFKPEYGIVLSRYFKEVDVFQREYPWVFKSVNEFNDYCNHLFYLKDLPVEDTFDTIRRYITVISNTDGTIHMKWKLLYFVCTI